MAIDILAHKKSQDILVSCPGLKNYGFPDYLPRQYQSMDRNKIVMFIVLMYSKDSILNKKTVTLEDRQRQAADLAGFTKNQKGQYPKYVIENLFELNDEKLRETIHNFLQKQPNGSFLWNEIVRIEHNIADFQKILLRPVANLDDEDQLTAAKKLRDYHDNISQFKATLDSYLKEFYAEHTTLKEKQHRRQVMGSIAARVKR